MKNRAPLWEETLLGIESEDFGRQSEPFDLATTPLDRSELERNRRLVNENQSFFNPNSKALSKEYLRYALGGENPAYNVVSEMLAFLLLEGEVIVCPDTGKLVAVGPYGAVPLEDIHQDVQEMYRCSVRLQLWGLDAWIARRLGLTFENRDIEHCLHISRRAGFSPINLSYMDGLT